MAQPKTVWLVRHGQAAHNVLLSQGKRDEAHALRDPGLTARGRQQAAKLRRNPLLREALAGAGAGPAAAELLVVSPMRRAVETACEGFGSLSLPLVLNPDCQECSDPPCDTGSPPAELQRLFEDSVLGAALREQLGALPANWFEKTGANAANRAAWAQRFDGFTQWLRAREEQRLIVVAHHRFFKEGLGVELENCEVVQFTLDEQGWQLAKRQPGQGGGPGDGAGEHEPPSAPPPFPVGVPPVMQAQVSRAAQHLFGRKHCETRVLWQGMRGTPYSARMVELVLAAVPLSLIVALLLAMVLGGEPAQ